MVVLMKYHAALRPFVINWISIAVFNVQIMSRCHISGMWYNYMSNVRFAPRWQISRQPWCRQERQQIRSNHEKRVIWTLKVEQGSVITAAQNLWEWNSKAARGVVCFRWLQLWKFHNVWKWLKDMPEKLLQNSDHLVCWMTRRNCSLVIHIDCLIISDDRRHLFGIPTHGLTQVNNK